MAKPYCSREGRNLEPGEFFDTDLGIVHIKSSTGGHTLDGVSQVVFTTAKETVGGQLVTTYHNVRLDEDRQQGFPDLPDLPTWAPGMIARQHRSYDSAGFPDLAGVKEVAGTDDRSDPPFGGAARDSTG